jgi:hypothetical protein
MGSASGLQPLASQGHITYPHVMNDKKSTAYLPTKTGTQTKHIHNSMYRGYEEVTQVFEILQMHFSTSRDRVISQCCIQLLLELRIG